MTPQDTEKLVIKALAKNLLISISETQKEDAKKNSFGLYQVLSESLKTGRTGGW